MILSTRNINLGPVKVSLTIYPLLVLGLSLFALAPLFYPGYFQTHSGFIPWWNLADLRANPAWNWLPHIATSFDPLRSEGLLPYYLAAILPFEPVTAIKIIMGLGWLLGSMGIFMWLKTWLGRPGALVAAVVYTYLPYRIATVYVRGAWGEALFWGLLPLAIYQVQEVIGDRDGSPRPLQPHFGLFLAWVLLGLSQLGLTLWAFLFTAMLFGVTHPRRARRPIAVAFLGVILAVITTFSIRATSPLASPMSSPALPLFADHYLYPFQLLSAQWDFGPSRPGWDDGLSFQLGLAAIGLTVISLVLWQRPGPNSPVISRTDRRLWFFVGATTNLILLQFGVTDFLWRLPLWPGYTLSGTLTYPWQLLGLAGLGLAVMAGVNLRLDEQLTRLPLFSALIILVILSSYPYLEPKFIQVDQISPAGPQAQLGAGQLALLDHDFSTVINGNTAGLERSLTTIPFTASGPLKPDETLILQVTWQPLQPFNEDWKVFVHLVDPHNKVLAQFDGQPQAGDYPTSRWIPGELIKDSYPLPLTADAPPGPYRVFVGLYHEATGARLPVPGDTEGRVILNVQ